MKDIYHWKMLMMSILSNFAAKLKNLDKGKKKLKRVFLK